MDGARVGAPLAPIRILRRDELMVVKEIVRYRMVFPKTLTSIMRPTVAGLEINVGAPLGLGHV